MKPEQTHHPNHHLFTVSGPEKKHAAENFPFWTAKNADWEIKYIPSEWNQ